MASYTLSKRSHQHRIDLSLIADSLRFPWVTLVFVTGFSIAALLAGRLWLQMGDPSTTKSGARGLLLSITEFFVSPVRGQQSSNPTSSTNGVFEFATLEALQAYLVATLFIVVAIVAARVAMFVASQDEATKPAPAGKRAVLTLQPASLGATSAAASTHSPIGISKGEES